MVDITKQIYGEKIEKSPSFAPEIKVWFSDDASIETMKKFNDGEDWMEDMIKEVILDWNLTVGEEKMPICIESLDKIKSLKLRNWIISTLGEIIVEGLGEIKKKIVKQLILFLDGADVKAPWEYLCLHYRRIFHLSPDQFSKISYKTFVLDLAMMNVEKEMKQNANGRNN